MFNLANYVVSTTSLILLCFFDFDTSRVTSKLRYYPKEYVRQFMAEAMSFVLRNAPDVQLKRGMSLIVFLCIYIFPPRLLSCLLFICLINITNFAVHLNKMLHDFSIHSVLFSLVLTILLVWGGYKACNIVWLDRNWKSHHWGSEEAISIPRVWCWIIAL